MDYLREQVYGGVCWELQLRERLKDKLCLEQYGYRVYSQNDEDGILSHIFSVLGTTDRRFVEFGVGNGLECNSHLLLLKGWSGLWLERDEDSYQSICELFKKVIKSGRLAVYNTSVSVENINHILEINGLSGEIDLLSIDIDGNDYYVWGAIDQISPRVVVIEYNATIPPDVEFIQDYDENGCWDGSDCFGASLRSLEKLGSKKGYRLVGTGISGVNAFFVRNDLAVAGFCDDSDAEHLYNPPRYGLTFLGGHPNRKYIGDR